MKNTQERESCYYCKSDEQLKQLIKNGRVVCPNCKRTLKQHNEVEEAVKDFRLKFLTKSKDITKEGERIISEDFEIVETWLKQAFTTQRKTITAELNAKHREEIENIIEEINQTGLKVPKSCLKTHYDILDIIKNKLNNYE